VTGGLISVAEALRRVLDAAPAPVAVESVALEKALGRTLAEDLTALRTQPPFANSAMDGYALIAADTSAPEARLKVIGESAAGRAFSGPLGHGEAVRIFSGAPMPAGADAVLIQENAAREGEIVIAKTSETPGQYVRPPAMDFASGEILLAAGRRLTPRDLALAAAGNHAALKLRRRPRVAILATGDELVPPGAPLGPAQIVASNNFAVAGIVAACGGEPVDLGIAVDEVGALVASFERAATMGADVLITLGGASVGDYDLVQKALISSGLELGFWRIAMRPGKPLMHGKLGAMTVLGLPGNPVSAVVCATVFVRPLLLALLGDPDARSDISEIAAFGDDVGGNDLREDYLRATLAQKDGQWLASPVEDQDSSLVKLLTRSQCLIIRKPHAPPAKRGEACRIIRFDRLGL